MDQDHGTFVVLSIIFLGGGNGLAGLFWCTGVGSLHSAAPDRT